LLLSAFLAAACGGDDKAGSGLPVRSVAAPPQQALYNPNAPAGDPEQPEGNADQPLGNADQPAGNPNQPSGASSPPPVPTGGPGPGGPGTIRCSRLCDGLEGQCAQECSSACSPYEGQAFPCRDELEELMDCVAELCESGGTSGSCEAEIAMLQSCAQSAQPSGG
jgi:hypothetical protein